MSQTFAEVVFPNTVNRAFTYRIPPELSGLTKVGVRVVAPFGARKLTGFVAGFKDKTDLAEVKEIQDVLDVAPLVSAELLKLARWISEYYLASLGDTLKAMIPASLMQVSRKYIEVTSESYEEHAARIEKRAPRQAQILRWVGKSGRVSVAHLKRRIGARSLFSSLSLLEERGLIRQAQLLASATKPKTVNYVRLTQNGFWDASDDNHRLGPKQQQCLDYLRVHQKEILQSELLQATAGSSQTLRSLEKRQLIEIVTREIERDYYGDVETSPPKSVTLNPEQAAALLAISTGLAKNDFRTYLLHGVTGSGKTQVYIESIAKVLALGKDAIVLVPEISLTPQTVQRFRAHFGADVAVLHSAMSDGERYDSWRRLKDGRARVAIGPRSAVFAPLRNLGLIIVDEAHEDSYKQAEPAPRYHARDVAIVRAKLANAVVVLGSATPSAESYYNALNQKHELLELNQRIDGVPLPEVTIVDMKKERRLSGKKETPIFSRLLKEKIDEKLSRREQIILLLNRRGFSSHIKCRDCGYVEKCDNCEISLTYHIRGRRLRCHYCGLTKRAPNVCPDCGGDQILLRGMGTQKVEEAVQMTFPGARIVRMDLDTTSQKRSHDRILQAFERGDYDILLGTQMIAKGLDFQRVTLVGAINADVGLLLPDFRSTERTFQLLTQVAGRAGRKDLPGEVVIQTYSPDAFCLQCAKNHDFRKFFSGDIMERRELLYPPFGRMVLILFKGKEESKVMQAAQNYANVIRKLQGPFLILGPTPSPIIRIRNKYRWHVLLKDDKQADPAGRKIRAAVMQAEKLYREQFVTRGVQIAVDVDPVSLI